MADRTERDVLLEAMQRAKEMKTDDGDKMALNLARRIVLLDQTGSSIPSGRVTSFGGPRELAKGMGRGVRGALGLPGMLQDVGAPPEQMTLDDGQVVQTHDASRGRLPTGENINTGLEHIGIDPSILEGGEDSFLGRTGEFLGAGGTMGGAQRVARGAQASGIKGLAKESAKFTTGTGTASVASEVGGNFAEDMGFPRMAGNITGAIVLPSMIRLTARMLGSQSARNRTIGRGQNQENVQRADDYLIKISHGTASPSTRAKFTERLLAAMPGGVRVMHDHSLKVVNDVQRAMARVSTPMKGMDANPETAGIGISVALNRHVRAMETKGRQLYKIAEQRIDPATPVRMTGTTTKIREMSAEADEAISEWVKIITSGREQLSPQLKGALDAITGGNPNAIAKMTFAQANALRKAIGKEIGNSSSGTNPYYGELKALYGTVADDIGAGLTGPQNTLWRQSVDHWRKYRNEVDDFIDPIFGSAGKETGKYSRLYRNVFGTDARNIETVRVVWKTLNAAERDLVAKTLILRMGKVSENAKLGNFDNNPNFGMQSWLNKWNSHEFAPAKKLIFESQPGYKRDLDSVAQYMDDFISTNAHLQNPSGSGMVGLAAATTFFALAGMGTAMVDEDASTALRGAAGGVVGVVAASLGAKWSAQAMTNPTFVRWLAAGTKVPASQTPQHFARLVMIAEREPEIAEAIGALMSEIALITAPGLQNIGFPADQVGNETFPNLPGTL